MQKHKPIDALRGSGHKAGLEIWVVRAVKPPKKSTANLFNPQHNAETEYELFTVSPAKHGVFYTEDLYIVARTTEGKDKNLHFWIGKSYNDTPPPWLDKFEDLDLGWSACQHFEFQGLECELFESYFQGIQPAIRYKRGRHPDPYAERVRGDTRFYKLERLDKAHYRVREIPFNIALMTKEECFILDTDYNTRTYVSDRTTADERNKSIIVANRIRELDHEGNGDIEVVELTTFSNDADREAYYVKAAKLQEQNDEAPVLIDYDQPDDDPTSPIVQLNMITLLSSEDADIGYPPRFRYVPIPKKVIKEEKKGVFARLKKNLVHVIQVITGQETKKEIEYEIPMLDEKFVKSAVEKPFKPGDLNPKKCYLLQGTPGQGVIMWAGSASDEDCRSELTECLRLEQKRCDSTNENYDNEFEMDNADDPYRKKVEVMIPQWSHAVKVIEGHEPLKFKRYFQDWE